MSEFQVAQTAWSRTLLHSLAASGIRHFVVSPGSRSTPLVAALQSLGLAFDVVIDERSAGFFALGRAKATGVASVLVCTSGSAAAHYFPAVVEADESQTPLLILSADRPPELQGNRSAQTIEQGRLFGSKARWFDDLGVPEASELALRGLQRKAAQAVSRSRFPIPGPVQLNVPLRKPLEPAGPAPTAELKVTQGPCPRHFEPHLEPSSHGLLALKELAAAARRPLLVAGPFAPGARPSRECLQQFAQKTGWPVLLEATSNLRFGVEATGEALVVDAFDSVFRGLQRVAGEVREQFRPDFVLAIGDTPTSTSWLELTRGAPKAVLGQVLPPDPSNDTQLFVPGDIERALSVLAIGVPAPDPAFRERLRRANTLAWQIADALSADRARDLSRAAGDEVFDHEGQCTRLLGEALTAGDLLVIGNSLPVRLVDSFVRANATPIDVVSQRGANGIDGLLASAAGAAGSRRGPTFLLLGDVSFLHDVGSLGLLAQLAPHLVVVVFNNQGGRLFEQLPVATTAAASALAPWLTPHSFDLSAIAAAFGIPSSSVGTATALQAELRRARETARPQLIEVRIAASGTRAAYQELEARLQAAFADEPWPVDAAP